MQRLLLILVFLLIVVAVAALVSATVRRRLIGRRDDAADAERSPMGVPDWPLFLLPLPGALAAVVALTQGQLRLLLGNALGYGLLLGGALLVRGARGEDGALIGGRGPWRNRQAKSTGAGMIALGSGLTAWLGAGHPLAIGLTFALVTLIGFHLVYGLALRRPLWLRRRTPGLSAHGEASLRRATLAVDAIEQARREIRQPELAARLADIAALARQIIDRLQDDPRNLWRARKFLSVYLDGVQRVIEGYAKTHGQITAPALDQRFGHALDTVEAAFREQYQVLLERDVEDLDVQIEVLTRQLEREGI